MGVVVGPLCEEFGHDFSEEKIQGNFVSLLELEELLVGVVFRSLNLSIQHVFELPDFLDFVAQNQTQHIDPLSVREVNLVQIHEGEKGDVFLQQDFVFAGIEEEKGLFWVVSLHEVVVEVKVVELPLEVQKGEDQDVAESLLFLRVGWEEALEVDLEELGRVFEIARYEAVYYFVEEVGEQLLGPELASRVFAEVHQGFPHAREEVELLDFPYQVEYLYHIITV